MKKFIFSLLLIFLPLQLYARLSPREITTLIKRYAPLIKLSAKDASSPTPIKWYVERCALKQRSSDKQPDRLILDKGKVNLSELGKYKNNQSDREYFLDPLDNQETLKGPGYVNNISDVECYVNVVQRTPDTLLLQYWFFYAYQGGLKSTELTNEMMKNLGGGVHEGDWEHVSVHLIKKNGDYDINQIFFSRHREEDGEMVPKEKADFVNDDMKPDTLNGTHVVVYAALNSHANYPHFYSEVRATKFMDYLSNDGPVWRCWTNPIYMGTIQTPAIGQEWILYAGRWGATIEHTAAGALYHGNSPFGPAFDKGFARHSVPKSPITTTIKNKSVPSIPLSSQSLEKRGLNIRVSDEFSLTIPARIKKLEWRVNHPSQHDFTYEIWQRKWNNDDQLQFGPLPGRQPFVTNLPTSPTNLYVANIKGTSVPNYELGKLGQLVIRGVEED